MAGSIRQDRVKLPREQVMIDSSKGTRCKYQSTFGSIDADGRIEVAIWYIGDEVNADQTYSDWYLKENCLGKYANNNSKAASKEEDKKKSKESESEEENKSGLDSFGVKLLLTIIPILPAYWIIKLPFKFIYAKCANLINSIFCGCCSKSECSIWPYYSLTKF